MTTEEQDAVADLEKRLGGSCLEARDVTVEWAEKGAGPAIYHGCFFSEYGTLLALVRAPEDKIPHPVHFARVAPKK